MWHVTRDMLHAVGGGHSLKISAPYLFWFVIYDILKIRRKKLTEWLPELITRLILEQPRLHRVC